MKRGPLKRSKAFPFEFQCTPSVREKILKQIASRRPYRLICQEFGCSTFFIHRTAARAGMGKARYRSEKSWRCPRCELLSDRAPCPDCEAVKRLADGNGLTVPQVESELVEAGQGRFVRVQGKWGRRLFRWLVRPSRLLVSREGR